MKPRTTFEIATDVPALILYWPDADGGLWDPEISALVEYLEEELEVFVTCVGSGRGALGMDDAAAAARFIGCSSLVVVSLVEARSIERELDDARRGSRLPIVVIGSEWTASAIAEAYHEGRRHALQAA